jgi:hypothetical protein
MDAVDIFAGICFDTGCHGCCPIGSEVMEMKDGRWLA